MDGITKVKPVIGTKLQFRLVNSPKWKSGSQQDKIELFKRQEEILRVRCIEYLEKNKMLRFKNLKEVPF